MIKALAAPVALAGAVIAAQGSAPRENITPPTAEPPLDRRSVGDRGAGDLRVITSSPAIWRDTDLKPAAPSTPQRP